MKKLPIDIEDVAMLMETVEHEDEYYLDTETGKTVIVPANVLYTDLDDPEETPDLPECEKESVPIRKAIEEGSERYEPLPELDSSEAFEQMEDFARTVEDPKRREQLFDALRGNHPFRRFKEALHQYPEELNRWYEFKEQAMAEYIREWLHGIGIEPISPEPEKETE